MIFLVLYLISLPLQLLTTGSLLQQGSTPLVVLTAIHAGVVVALFWALLANAIVATQVVEDGSVASLAVRLAKISIFLPITHSPPYLLAILHLHPHLSRRRYLRLPRYRTRDHFHHRGSRKSAREPEKYSTFRGHEYLACGVRPFLPKISI